METPTIRTIKLAILTKSICLLAAIILIMSGFYGHRPLIGTAFIVFAVMQFIGLIMVAKQRRELGYIVRLPFIIVFFLLVLFDFIM